MARFKNPELEAAHMNILDCYGGSDGGIRFVGLLVLLDRMEAEDSEASRQLIDIVLKMSRLIDAANSKS